MGTQGEAEPKAVPQDGFMLWKPYGLRSAPTQLEAVHPSPTLTCLHWMCDLEENWNVKQSRKSPWKLLGKYS